MKIPEIIRYRRSVRSFQKKDLPNGTTELLVESACWAPSAGNLQPWAFVAVTDDDVKMKLVEAAGEQSFIAEAPLVLVVCADPKRTAPRYGERGSSLYCLQDTAAAVQNILLTAVENGLGGCWIGAFDEDRAAKAVKLPSGIRPVAIIPIGYPAQSPTPRPRSPLSEVVHRNSW